MSENRPLTQSFEEALEAPDTDRVEELWLAALEESPIAVDELLEVRRRLWKAGQKTLASTLLELLAETLEAHNESASALEALTELVRLADKPDAAVVERLQQAFEDTRRGSPSLARVIERFPMRTARRPLEVLEIWERWLDHDQGTVVEVVGQGVGRVTDVNLELDAIKVDVGARRPVTVQFAGVARFLRRLPENDFRRLKVEDPEALREVVSNSPGESLVHLLESLGEPVDVTAIKGWLENLVDPGKWTSWWSKARSHPRVVASGTGSRLRYAAGGSAASATDALIDQLAASGPRERLAIARRVASRGSAASRSAIEILTRSLPDLEASDPGLAWETATLLGDLSGGSDISEAATHRLIESVPPLHLLSGIQDRTVRLQVLERLKTAGDGLWTELWAEWLLHEQHPAVLTEIALELERAGEADTLEATLEAVFRNHADHPAQFIWACELMTEPGCPEPVSRRMTPSLLEKLPDTLTRTEFAPLRARAKELLDGGKVAVQLILDRASAQQASRFVSRVVRVSTVEPGRLRVLEQAVRQLGEEAHPADTPLFVATREAVEAKRAELKQLLDVEIPKTLKGIQAAAAEGDLRENFEYHMLRDRQELQSARAAKLQQELAVVQVLEPGSADCSAVNIGTVVHLEGSGAQAMAPITILGSWDGDVERRIFANGSGVAAELLGKKIGDQAEVEGTEVTIKDIRPWTGDT